MPKLQVVTRKSGSKRYSLYLDSAIIDEMGWEKGQPLKPTIDIDKAGKKCVILYED